MFYYKLAVESDRKVLADLAVQELVYAHNLSGGAHMTVQTDRERAMAEHPSNGVRNDSTVVQLRPADDTRDGGRPAMRNNGKYQTEGAKHGQDQ